MRNNITSLRKDPEVIHQHTVCWYIYIILIRVYLIKYYLLDMFGGFICKTSGRALGS